MAYDEGLAKRLRDLFVDHPVITEKKMFGGLASMYRGHMLVGILGDSLTARVGTTEYADVLKRLHVRQMDWALPPIQRILATQMISAPGSPHLSGTR